jgi:protein SCO1/2
MRLRLLAASTGALISLALTACGSGSSSPIAQVKAAPLHGALPGQVASAPSVELTDTNGKVHNLADDAKSKVLLLYFGYTHCPDQCPTTMADVASAFRQLPSWVKQRVEMAFITTDPKRDTPAVLEKWLSRFSPDFIGLRGTKYQIQLAEAKVGIPLAQQVPAKPSDNVGAYAINHYSVVLAYDMHGQLEALYPTGTRPSTYVEDLPVLVADKVKTD